jgi:hypothetical protein
MLPAVVVIAAVVAFQLGVVELMRRAMDVGSKALYAGEIEVTKSEMFFGESKDGPTVFVVGLLRNRSDVPWRKVGMGVRFLDAEGKLIDAAVKADYLRCILPRGETAFKVRTLADLPKERYASYEVVVHSAEDATARW